MKKLIFSVLALLALSTASYGSVEIIVTGNNTFTTPRIIFAGSNQSSTMNWGLGGGALLNFSIGSAGKRSIYLEIGATYNPLKFTSAFSGATTTYEFPFIKIPLNVMVGLNKILYAGVGFYFSTLLGNVNQITTAGTTTTINSVTPASLGYSTMDYGFTAHLGLQFPIGPKSNLFVRGSYGIGIANLDNRNGNLLEFFELGAMAGLSFLFK